MSKFNDYIQESTDELLHKVSWPTWEELQSSVGIVVIATAIITAVVYVMDFAFSNLLSLLY